jgi:hypothetical protein
MDNDVCAIFFSRKEKEMNLIELTKKCAEAIPDFPKETVNVPAKEDPRKIETLEVVSFRHPSSKGKYTSFKYLVDDAVYEASAEWRISLKDPSQGSALCHFRTNGQEWIFRLYQHEEKFYAFSVGLYGTGRPRRLFTCYYDASSRYGTCSLCDSYGVLKFGEYGGMLSHIMRCAACQPLPCGEPTAPFNKELALST